MEYEQQIYNKIVSYYDMADRIQEEISKLDAMDNDTKFSLLMPLPEKIRSTADTLLEKYVKLLKNTDNKPLRDEITGILDGLLDLLYIYKNRVYDFYKNKQANG